MHEHESSGGSGRSRPPAIEGRERGLAPARTDGADGDQQLLAVCAHELRNPLSSLQSTLELLRESFASPALDPHFEVLDRQTRKLERIVEDLLDVSRAAQGKIALRQERIDLAVVVARAIESTRHVLEERRLTLRVNAPGRQSHVLADAVRLEQVFVNLLVNAAKYTDPGGQVTLMMKHCANTITLHVCDTGVGMTSEELARAFDLFAQVDPESERARGGLGVGLAVVKHLVELHGGCVQARSEGLGRGCEFVVTLPLAEETTEIRVTPAAARQCKAGAAAGRTQLRVLVVDDNHDVAEALARLLEHLGHMVRVAHDGSTALRAAGELLPDVAFIDICMPDMDGYAVARAFTRNALEPPLLVALTGYADESARTRAFAAGFAKHLVKPPRLTAIQALLQVVTPRVRHAVAL